LAPEGELKILRRQQFDGDAEPLCDFFAILEDADIDRRTVSQYRMQPRLKNLSGE
jgi:hypothetical protein